MKYFKANCDSFDWATEWPLIKNELVTEKERAVRYPNISNNCFDSVEISKNKTYKSFGLRFECK